MKNPNEILLGTGVELVRLCDVPDLIARALYPATADTATLLDSQAIRRVDAQAQHKRAITTAIHEGRLIQRTHARTAIPAAAGVAWNGGYVAVDDFRDYAAAYGVTVRVADDRITVRELARKIAGHQVDAHSAAHRKDGANNDLRRDIAQAMTETDIVAHVLQMATVGKITPHSPISGLPPSEPFNANADWYLSGADAETVLACLHAEAAIRAMYETQDDAKRKAGRYTLEEAARELVRISHR